MPRVPRMPRMPRRALEPWHQPPLSSWHDHLSHSKPRPFTMRWQLSYIFFSLLGFAQSISKNGRRLLVVVEEVEKKDNHSELWADLEGLHLGRDFNIIFESPKSDQVALFRHGERVFDHVMLFPPKSKGFGPLLTPNLLLQFLNQDGNILLVLSADSTIPSAISSLLVELDIHLPPDRKTLVVDHLNYDTISAPEKHDVLLLPHPPPIRSDLKTFFGGQGTIAFPKGVPQQLGTETPHLSSILRAKNTAYSYNPQDESESVEDPYTVGGQVSLVSAFQARNSARLTVFGSSQALENQWFNAKIKGLDGKQSITSNKLFAKQVTAWTFKETGVLHVGRMEHRLSSIDDESLKNNTVALLEGQNPKIYRIKNDVVCSAPSSIKICLIKSPKTFNVELSEYSYDHLSPFTILPADALQLEFTMLSAFYRLDLKPIFQTTNSNVFGTSFKLPDQHGIFTFRINYKRPFLTNIDVKEEVTLRHFAHDEWPRSWEISAGWVWIAGLWVTVIGWIAFVALWLWSEPSLERS